MCSTMRIRILTEELLFTGRLTELEARQCSPVSHKEGRISWRPTPPQILFILQSNCVIYPALLEKLKHNLLTVE